MELVGGINLVDAPVALCVGGSNRLTGELARPWGASWRRRRGGSRRFMRGELVPTAILAKALHA